MRVLPVALVAVVCLAAWTFALAPAPPAPPSIGEAQADFASGDYAGCLRKISSLLGTRQVKPGSPERYDLLVLRGECMLRLKQRAAAQEAFGAAAMVMKNRQDLPRVAAAKGMSVLVKESPGLTYKPGRKSNDQGASSPADAAIDIVNPDSRKVAFQALYQDKAAELAPVIAKAMQDKSLVPINSLLPDAWELYTADFCAKGDAARTEDTLVALGAHARTLMGDELNGLIARREELRHLATEPTVSGIGNQSISYRGLNSHERKELADMADQLMKIQRTAEDARRISRALGSTGENWDGLLADCAVARDVAQQAYDRRY